MGYRIQNFDELSSYSIIQFENEIIRNYFDAIEYDLNSVEKVLDLPYKEFVGKQDVGAYLQFKSIENTGATSSQIEELKTSRQGFFIDATNDRVIIVATNKYGYLNGFYYVLNKLGFKALNFKNDWDIVPSKIVPFTEKGVKIKSIESFSMGPTGLEWPENTELLQKFLKRNQAFQSITARSHTFSPKEMLKFAKGTRFQKSKNYWEDIYKQTGEYPLLKDEKGRYTLPNLDLGEPVWQMLVDFVTIRNNEFGAPLSPPDGANGESTINLPSSIPQIKNHHELYWYTAIEVAKRVNFNISYNAYGNGSLSVQPPKFVLPPNMEVTCIPYAFQTFYLTDTEMFEAWNIKSKETESLYGSSFKQNVYDYWNITSWTGNGGINFDFDSFSQGDKLKKWEKYGFEHINIEGTFYSIPILPELWLTTNYVRDNSKSPDEYYNEYLQLMYGDGWHTAKEMYSLFSVNGFGKNTAPYWYEKVKSLLNNQSLSDFEKNNARRLAVYFNWWHLRWTAEETMSKDDFDKMLTYAHKFEDLGLFQTRTLTTRKYGLKVPKGYTFKKRNQYINASKKYDLEKEENYFRSLNYPKVFQLLNSEIDITKAKPLEAFQQSNIAPMYRYEAVYEIKVDKETPFEFTVELANNKSPMKIQMYDDDIYSGENMLINKSWQNSERGNTKTLKVIIPPNRLFKLIIAGGIEKTNFPSNVFVKYTDATRVGTIQQIKWYYVYVPKNADKIVYKLYTTPKNLEYRFEVPDGRGGFQLHPENNGNPFDVNSNVIKGNYYNGSNLKNTKLLVYNVPPELRGKVWRTKMSGFWRVPIMNFEKFYSRQPFLYQEN